VLKRSVDGYNEKSRAGKKPIRVLLPDWIETRPFSGDFKSWGQDTEAVKHAVNLDAIRGWNGYGDANTAHDFMGFVLHEFRPSQIYYTSPDYFGIEVAEVDEVALTGKLVWARFDWRFRTGVPTQDYVNIVLGTDPPGTKAVPITGSSPVRSMSNRSRSVR